MTDRTGIPGDGVQGDGVRGDGGQGDPGAQPPAAPLSMPRQVLEARRGTTLRALLTRLILPDA